MRYPNKARVSYLLEPRRRRSQELDIVVSRASILSEYKVHLFLMLMTGVEESYYDSTLCHNRKVVTPEQKLASANRRGGARRRPTMIMRLK
eukprot:5994179-Pleurochrysis_carterae.AAC.1